MLDFIWHLRGSTPLKDVQSNEEVLDNVEHLLHRQRKSLIHRSSDGVIFKSPFWEDAFGPNWLAMVLYDGGRFWIKQDAGRRLLKYDLCSLHGFAFCLLVAVMFFAFGVASDGLIKGTKYAAFAFGWLYGVNMLLAWIRIPRAVRAAVAQT